MTANDEPAGPRPEKKRRLSIGKVIAFVAVVIALIFIGQNSETGSVSFLFWEFTLPAWVWAGGLFVSGALPGTRSTGPGCAHGARLAVTTDLAGLIGIGFLPVTI